MNMSTQTAVHIPTGISVASRPVTDAELVPEPIRENPGAVELSRAEPTRGSVTFIVGRHEAATHRRNDMSIGKIYLRKG